RRPTLRADGEPAHLLPLRPDGPPARHTAPARGPSPSALADRRRPARAPGCRRLARLQILAVGPRRRTVDRDPGEGDPARRRALGLPTPAPAGQQGPAGRPPAVRLPRRGSPRPEAG